jgi:hypothetical protein
VKNKTSIGQAATKGCANKMPTERVNLSQGSLVVNARPHKTSRSGKGEEQKMSLSEKFFATA